MLQLVSEKNLKGDAEERDFRFTLRTTVLVYEAMLEFFGDVLNPRLGDVNSPFRLQPSIDQEEMNGEVSRKRFDSKNSSAR